MKIYINKLEIHFSGNKIAYRTSIRLIALLEISPRTLGPQFHNLLIESTSANQKTQSINAISVHATGATVLTVDFKGEQILPFISQILYAWENVQCLTTPRRLPLRFLGSATKLPSPLRRLLIKFFHHSFLSSWQAAAINVEANKISLHSTVSLVSSVISTIEFINRDTLLVLNKFYFSKIFL